MKRVSIIRQLSEISTSLAAQAGEYPALAEGHIEGHYDLPAIFAFGTLIIRCRPTREAVLAVAAKYGQKSYSFFSTRHNALLPKHSMFVNSDTRDKLRAQLTAEGVHTETEVNP